MITQTYITHVIMYRGAALVGSCFATPPKRSSTSTSSSSSTGSSSSVSDAAAVYLKDTAVPAAVAQSRPTAGYEQGAELLSKWMTAASLTVAAPCLRLVSTSEQHFCTAYL
jgi:hypothetical protein